MDKENSQNLKNDTSLFSIRVLYHVGGRMLKRSAYYESLHRGRQYRKMSRNILSWAFSENFMHAETSESHSIQRGYEMALPVGLFLTLVLVVATSGLK